MVFWLACLLASAGCEPSSSQRIDRDAEVDPGPVDGGSDAHSEHDAEVDGGDACDRERAREAEFVESHRACSVHGDCVAIGSCSDTNAIAVNTSSQAEAQALFDARTCGSAPDGPTYHAICNQGACELAYARLWCGIPTNTECPDGQQYFTSGCGGAPEFAGCFTACSAGDSSACSPGYTCQQVEVDPCGGGVLDGDACQACGAQAHLCMPDPGCEVTTHVKLDGLDRAALPNDGAAFLSVRLVNQTDAPLRFTFDLSCHGPDVSGLPGYDLWDACLQGPCSEDIVPHTVTLAARESKTLAETLLGPVATSCNPAPLAPATYRLGYALTNVQGARACAAPAAQLLVHDGPTDW
jgi:hypothetical protein